MNLSSIIELRGAAFSPDRWFCSLRYWHPRHRLSRSASPKS